MTLTVLRTLGAKAQYTDTRSRKSSPPEKQIQQFVILTEVFLIWLPSIRFCSSVKVSIFFLEKIFSDTQAEKRASMKNVDVQKLEAKQVSWAKRPKMGNEMGDESGNISLRENVNNEKDRCSDQAYMKVAGGT